MDMVNISLGTGGLVALLGYAVVFVGIILLMLVVMLMSRLMMAKAKKAVPAEQPVQPVREPEKAHGTAGDLKLYDTDPRDAAMIMAIVAHRLGKPLNELRFISIREVKNDEI